MINLNKVDNFPELTRSGRVSSELQSIIDALVDSANNGSRFAISGVEPGKSYNSMQQRIRAQASKLNFKVVIRFDADDQKLYFKASKAFGQPMVPVTNETEGIIEDTIVDSIIEDTIVETKASDIKSVKTQASKAKITK